MRSEGGPEARTDGFGAQTDGLAGSSGVGSAGPGVLPPEPCAGANRAVAPRRIGAFGGWPPGAVIPGLAGVRRALAVVAHPDDESFGLGGVLAELVAAGVDVDLLCFTAGEASTVGATAHLGELRAGELAEAAAALGLGRAWLVGLPDGSLQEHREEMAKLVRERVGDADLLVVMEPSGVTGHPDHRAATVVASAVAAELGRAVLEWGVSPAVAAALADELGAPLVGLDGPDVVLVRVARATQLSAIACHRTQNPGNPLLARRLELQGDTERVRLRPAPFPARLAWLAERLTPLARADATPEEQFRALEQLIGFAAAEAGRSPGVDEGPMADSARLLHEVPGRWRLYAEATASGVPRRELRAAAWTAVATADGAQRASSPAVVHFAPVGSGYVVAGGQTWQVADATGRASAWLRLEVGPAGS